MSAGFAKTPNGERLIEGKMVSDPHQVIMREFFNQAIEAHKNGMVQGLKAGGALGFLVGVAVTIIVGQVVNLIMVFAR